MMKDMKEQLTKYLVITINGNLIWGFSDSLGQFFCYDREGTNYGFQLGLCSAEEIFLVIRDENSEIIYECETATLADEEEREILHALYKVVNMLYRNPSADKDAIFY